MSVRRIQFADLEHVCSVCDETLRDVQFIEPGLAPIKERKPLCFDCWQYKVDAYLGRPVT